MQTKQKKIADTQDITQSSIEDRKGGVKAMTVIRVQVNSVLRNNEINTEPKLGGPSLKEPTFDWSSTHKYGELRNFKLV